MMPSAAARNFVDMLQQVSRVLKDAIGACALQLIYRMKAGQSWILNILSHCHGVVFAFVASRAQHTPRRENGLLRLKFSQRASSA
jgi:hypothetical protein